MHFRRIRLAGFKSFVDPVELRIDDGLTGVVGPNGCGKSNLLEAIRWVMGESSAKSMRGGGMEDVIFAGTDRRPARDAAHVTLHLDNSSRRAPAQFNDSDDLEVVRHIERGLGSAYRVNGRDVRQKDVQLLFADAATGAHSPALVSQGRIGAIIAAKPQDRRLLLEEAAGISGLYVRRKDAEQRLRAAETNLTRLDDVLQGLSAQAANLKRQARQAERYKKLSEQIRIAEAMLLYAKAAEANADANAAKAEAEALRGKIEDATRLGAAISARQADAAANLPPLREAEAEAAAILQRLKLSRDSLNAELNEVERRRREAEARREAAERDIAREDALHHDAHAALERLAAEDAAIAARLAEAEAALGPAEARITDLEAVVEADQRALADALAAQAEAQGQRRAIEAELSALRSQIARAESEKTRTLAAQAAAAQGDDAGERLIAAEGRAKDAEAEAERASAAIATGEERRAGAETARDAAQAKRGEAQAALSALTGERQSLERSLAASRGGDAEPLIDRVRVTKGFEAAFAASLGDDTAAPVGGESGRRWGGATKGEWDPALPAGARPLSEVITAPEEIARRAAQIGVVDDEMLDRMAAKLSVGQRLVTTEGRLVRWDGFRTEAGDGSAAAEKLRQRNRLAEVEALLPDAEAAVEALDTEFAAARAIVAETASAIDGERQALRRAEAARAEAAKVMSQLAGEVERRAAQLEAFAAAVTRANDQIAECGEKTQELEAALLEVPAAEGLTEAVTAARNTADAHRSDLAMARAEHVALQRGLQSDGARRDAITAEREAWERRISGSTAQREELAARIAAANATIAEIADVPAAIAERQARLAGDLADAEAARQAAADRLAEAEGGLRTIDGEAREATEILSTLREERGRIEVRVETCEHRRTELNRLSVERFQCSPQMLPQRFEFSDENMEDPETLNSGLDRLTGERERMGPVNLRADVELEEIETTLTTSTSEREELETAIARLRGSIGSLNREGRARLLTAFEEVNRHFGDLFTSLFGGGEARLELIESDDPLEAGLEIMAQPPGKKLQSLTLLSGGEQALTAVALIFGLFLTNPAPICVLDEVDAPLDDANIERFCDLLDRMTTLTDTRFLIVTHNAVTMSRMHRLYGVTMGEKGVSQLVSVDLGRAETLLAAE
ncbi:chromosome segregation SMC family protein [Sphingosinicella sp.]|uniref:chromosome segregation SMC family protein n=1 Tax=Sphingosinicella sp. TaxID=1917971 RepID=UPI0035B0B8F0